MLPRRLCKTIKHDRYLVDLKQANVAILLHAGVPENQIVQSQRCTSCQPRIVFIRIDRDQGDTGRMVAWIGKRGEEVGVKHRWRPFVRELYKHAHRVGRDPNEIK